MSQTRSHASISHSIPHRQGSTSNFGLALINEKEYIEHKRKIRSDMPYEFPLDRRSSLLFVPLLHSSIESSA